MMNCQEFETALRANATLCHLIFNDSSYGLIKWETDGSVRKELLRRFYKSGFCEVSGKYGAIGYRITKAGRAGANP